MRECVEEAYEEADLWWMEQQMTTRGVNASDTKPTHGDFKVPQGRPAQKSHEKQVFGITAAVWMLATQ